MMTSWSSLNCGGGGISVEVENPDGTRCLTTGKDMSRGETLLWSEKRGLSSDCLNMSINEECTLYVQTTRADDFCPQHIWITTEDGAVYASSNITAWYDKEKTNSKKHALVKSQSQPSNLRATLSLVLLERFNFFQYPIHVHCMAYMMVIQCVISQLWWEG